MERHVLHGEQTGRMAADRVDELLAAAEPLVGPVQMVADHSWSNGVSTVIEVRASTVRCSS